MSIFTSESVKLLNIIPKYYFFTGYIPINFIPKAEYRGDGISFFDTIDLDLYSKLSNHELFAKNIDLELYRKLLDLYLFEKNIELREKSD